jgi:hypothetical protein
MKHVSHNLTLLIENLFVCYDIHRENEVTNDGVEEHMIKAVSAIPMGLKCET